MSQPRKDSLGVLKSIWRKDESGKWVIHDLQGIDLNPAEGYGQDFFKIKNELNSLTSRPGPLMNQGPTMGDWFSTFGGTEFLLKQSIVPIVAWNDGDSEIKCIGTGFFISASGYLLTAAHVLRDPVDEKYAELTQVEDRTFKLNDSFHLGIIIPPNPAMKNAPFPIHPAIREAKAFVHPIKKAYHWGTEIQSPLFNEKPRFKYDLDIAIVKVKESAIGAFQPLNTGLHRLNVGDQAVAIGYAGMKNIPRTPSGGIGDFQHDLFVSVGNVTNVYSENIEDKQSPTPGPCFDFNAKIPGKMSGGPILVGSGVLTKGVISRSWQDENHATGCLIAPLLGVPLSKDRSLFEMMKHGSEGIAQVSGPDL